MLSFLFSFSDQDTHGTLSVRAESVESAQAMIDAAGIPAVFVGIDIPVA